MPDSFLFEWLQQLDLSAVGDISELDWSNIATYGAILVAIGGAIWTSSKNFIRLIWSKTEGLISFVISSIVVFSLWYSLLRVHVSISFNLDKELFDNFLWLSAVLFTPYYLVHYGLLKGFVLTLVRSTELILDLLIFSWFPQRAEQNRIKWKKRVTDSYQFLKESLQNLGQMGLHSLRPVPTSGDLNTSSPLQNETGNDTSQ